MQLKYEGYVRCKWGSSGTLNGMLINPEILLN
jgi:hypothetical protein